MHHLSPPPVRCSAGFSTPCRRSCARFPWPTPRPVRQDFAPRWPPPQTPPRPLRPGQPRRLHSASRFLWKAISSMFLMIFDTSSLERAISPMEAVRDFMEESAFSMMNREPAISLSTSVAALALLFVMARDFLGRLGKLLRVLLHLLEDAAHILCHVPDIFCVSSCDFRNFSCSRFALSLIFRYAREFLSLKNAASTIPTNGPRAFAIFAPRTWSAVRASLGSSIP